MVDEQLAAIRTEYETAGLSRDMLDADPNAQFRAWMDAAIDAGVDQANMMVLATADAHGRPSARAVLLKGIDDRGFAFYTNLESRKSRELAQNPQASLCFVWLPLHRQVRVEGHISEVSDADVDEYFASRPRDAQIGATASPQSREVADRSELEALIDDVADRAAGGDIVRPDHWGGFRVYPTVIEFWQGRRHRLHDRLVYERSDSGWTVTRLAP